MLAEYDIPFVVDEVICGFGLIGEMFGSTTYAVWPEVMVLSRQIASSYVPFSAIVMNARFFTPMADESDRIRTFGHGYTAGGHPLGGAVALENLTIIDEDDLVGNARDVGAEFRARLEVLKSSSQVGEARGVEVVEDKVANSVATPGELGVMMNVAMHYNSLISCDMTDAVAFCPAMIITRQQVDDMFEIIARSLAEVEAEIGA